MGVKSQPDLRKVIKYYLYDDYGDTFIKEGVFTKEEVADINYAYGLNGSKKRWVAAGVN